MNIEGLKKVLKPIVKEAIKEEIGDLLTEAVKIASTPTNTQPKQVVEQQEDVMTEAEKQAIAEQKRLIRERYQQMNPVERIMEDTRRSMEEPVKPNRAHNKAASLGMLEEGGEGSLTNLSFVKKAKKIYDKAVEDKK